MIHSCTNLKLLVQTFRITDCIPIISTITNSAEIFLKACCPKYLNEAAKQKNYLAKHINKKSFLICFIGLVPLFGNLAICIYRLTRKRTPLEIAKKIAQTGKPESLHNLAFAYANAGKIEKSYKITYELSEKNDPKAMYIMAQAYQKGIFSYPQCLISEKHITADQHKALSLYKAIIQMPDIETRLKNKSYKSQFNATNAALPKLVELIEMGNPYAYSFLEELVEKNTEDAQFVKAEMLLKGNVLVKKNEKEAAKIYYKLTCNKFNMKAFICLINIAKDRITSDDTQRYAKHKIVSILRLLKDKWKAEYRLLKHLCYYNIEPDAKIITLIYLEYIEKGILDLKLEEYKDMPNLEDDEDNVLKTAKLNGRDCSVFTP